MAFEELKERQSVMWGAAPFENYVHWLAEMHDDLVERLDPSPASASSTSAAAPARWRFERPRPAPRSPATSPPG